MKIFISKLVAVTLILASLWGCVQTRPLPGYARTGDIVILGLGGIERNWSGLKPDDLNITITDSLNETHDLRGSNIFKSYPDHMAYMNTVAMTGQDQSLGMDLVPFDGGWFVAVPLSVPGSSAVLPLATGQATISITAPNLTNTNGPLEGDLTSIGIEILPGETSLDSEYLQQFVGYAPTSDNFVVSPGNLGAVDDVAGAFFKIDYYDDSYFLNGIEPVVVPSSHNPYAQLAYNVVSNGNGTGSIKVTLLNPAGFKPGATADSNSSLLTDLSVNLVYFPAAADAQGIVAKTVFELDDAGSYYIDGDGAIIEELAPSLIHSADL